MKDAKIWSSTNIETHLYNNRKDLLLAFFGISLNDENKRKITAIEEAFSLLPIFESKLNKKATLISDANMFLSGVKVEAQNKNEKENRYEEDKTRLIFLLKFELGIQDVFIEKIKDFDSACSFMVQIIGHHFYNQAGMALCRLPT